MFEQAFKNIDDVLWKEAGCPTELDYTEQASWLLFLKYHDSIADAVADLGRPEEIGQVFSGFRNICMRGRALPENSALFFPCNPRFKKNKP